MSRSLALDLLDHVRWLAIDADTLDWSMRTEGTVSVARLDDLIRRAQDTRKLLKKHRLWESL